MKPDTAPIGNVPETKAINNQPVGNQPMHGRVSRRAPVCDPFRIPMQKINTDPLKGTGNRLQSTGRIRLEKQNMIEDLWGQP
jgi:hypothetical protein